MNSTPPPSSRELLARYRALCEIAGEAKATGQPLSFADRADLYLVERALQLRLERSGDDPTPELSTGPAGASSSTSGSALARASVEQTSFLDANDRHADQPTKVEREPAVGDATPNGARPPSVPATPAEPIVARPATPGGPVRVYADGACLGNPGPGGYGVIVRVPGKPDREMSGGSPSTTNNQMELTGVIVGLRQAIQDGATEITVYSDSEYLVKGMTSWLAGWERKGWKTSAGQPVKNRDLWESLSQLARGRKITWTWIRGHAGHPENERCDELAVAAARQASLQRRSGR